MFQSRLRRSGVFGHLRLDSAWSRWSPPRALLALLLSCGLIALAVADAATGHNLRPARVSVRTAAGDYASTVLGENPPPVAYWRLGEASGATTAADATGNGHSGSIVGSPTLGVPGAVAEDSDTAMSFSGATQYVQVPPTGPPAAALNPAPPFTVEAWAKVTGGAGTTRIVVNSSAGSPARGYRFVAGAGNNWRFDVGLGGTTFPAVFGPTVALNTWTYLVGTVETIGASVQVTLYVNGSLAAQQTFSGSFAPNNTQPLRIGAAPAVLDEVAFYNYALSASQIAAHFSKAAIFDVSTTADTVDASPNGVCADAGGQCSLRAAIMEANFLFGPVVIKVPAGTYTLTLGPADDEASLNFTCYHGADQASGDLDIYAPVTIAGDGASSTIIQMNSSLSSPTACGGSATKDRIFDFDNNGIAGPSYDGLNVTISGVTLRNGSAPVASGATFTGSAAENGGAIRYSGAYDGVKTGTLTLKDCVIQGNTAAGNGGGVYAEDGVVSISNCTFSGNTAQNAGGGLYFDGASDHSFSPAHAEISNSTFSGNQAHASGGALSLTNALGSSFLRNTTLSGNSADANGGGLQLVSGGVTVTNATLTNNRAAVAGSGTGGGANVAAGTLTLQNTIVAGNFSGTGTTANDIGGSVNASSSFNLIGTGGAGGLTNGGNNNQVGVASPGLAPVLANNGGPTQTHALLLGSPALDAGSNALASAAGLTSDQRGAPFARVLDSADTDTAATVDIGALEQHPSVSTIDFQRLQGSPPKSVNFYVGDDGVTSGFGVDSLTASSSNPIFGLSITAGCGTGCRTLTITPASGQTGTATITIVATSTVGGTPLSMSSSFTASNLANSLPSVSVTSPTTGTTYVTPPSSVPINAIASDSVDGTVAKVDFYNNGTLIATDTTSPYIATLSSPTVGVHVLMAKATDNEGGTKSATVTVMVYAAATKYVKTVLGDGPVAYWRLDENVPNAIPNTMFDRTTNKNFGSYTGNPSLNQTGALTGDTDKAVRFNGTSQYGQVAYKAALNPTAAPFTVEAWVMLTGGTGNRAVIVSRDLSSTAARGYALYVGSDGHWQFWLGKGSTTTWQVLEGPLAILNGFTHVLVAVAAITGGVQATMYINGAQAAQNPSTSPFTFAANTTRPLRLAAGRTESTAAEYFPGTIDDVAFYKTAVSRSQVNAHYAAGRNDTPPTVSLNAPTSGSTFVAPSTITLSAAASDSDGSVARVDFYDNGAFIGTSPSTSSPYTFSWGTPASGVHVLTAVATDNLGVFTTSTAVTIMVYLAPSTYVNAVLADSPVAYWRLDENLGTTMFDRALHNNTGSFTGSPTLGATGALFDPDKAVRFNGTSQYGQVAYKAALNPTAAPFTVEAWVMLTGGTGNRAVIVSRDLSSTAARGYALYVGSDGHWQFWLGKGSTTTWQVLEGPAATLSAFTHVVVAVAAITGGVQATMYINGAQAAQNPSTGPFTFAANTTRPLRLAAGQTEGTPAQYFPGVLDDVAFYNTALSSTHISTHYTKGKSG